MMMIFILPAQSQLTVSKSGQSILGKRMYQNSPGFSTLANVEKEISISRPLVPIDTLASAVFLGRSTDNAGGYITFGCNKNVWIGEGMSSNSAWWDMMHLGFVNGIKASTRNGILNILSATDIVAKNVFNISGGSLYLEGETIRIEGNNVIRNGKLSAGSRELVLDGDFVIDNSTINVFIP
ncbi:MAG: hypothetical protein K2L35_01610 [Muribaculaceae bacterium]|nr:hypothetical protein [Muribaculaceae bacterium]